MKTLIIRSQDGRRTLAKLEWDTGRVRVLEATARMTPDVDRWVQDGLHDWIGTGHEAFPRTTHASDPRFLDHLEAYLRRQFRFDTTLVPSEAPRLAFVSWGQPEERSARAIMRSTFESFSNAIRHVLPAWAVGTSSSQPSPEQQTVREAGLATSRAPSIDANFAPANSSGDAQSVHAA